MLYMIQTQEHTAVEAKNEEEAEAMALKIPRQYWEQSEFRIEEADGPLAYYLANELQQIHKNR